MKRIIICLIAAIMFTGIAEARTPLVPAAAKASFARMFANAQQVSWCTYEKGFKAQFTEGETTYQVFFDNEGKFQALSHFMKTEALPLMLRTNLQRWQENATITELFVIESEEGAKYYCTLKKGKKLVVLESAGISDWIVFSTKKS